MNFIFNLKKEDFLFYAKYSCINSDLYFIIYNKLNKDINLFY